VTYVQGKLPESVGTSPFRPRKEKRKRSPKGGKGFFLFFPGKKERKEKEEAITEGWNGGKGRGSRVFLSILLST